MLKNENINLFANEISEKYFSEIILQNLLLLYNTKKAILQATRSTLQSNCHLTIGSYANVCYFIKLFIEKCVFFK